MIKLRHVCAAALALATLTVSPAFADDISKDACIDAHARGQDARDSGKLSLARKLFMTCAQSACPALVQNDCARFTDDLTRQQPSLGFTARDSGGSDLPDTSVYVDNILVVTRLDDGKPHDVDPGKHVVRFVHGGTEQEVTVVVGTGEKGRTVSATFPSAGGATNGPTITKSRPKITKHAGGAKALIGTGAALAVAGIAVTVYGLSSVPSGCTISTNTCAAPPGDPVFTEAHAAMRNADLGMLAAGVGVAALIGGTIWYKKSATTVRDEKRVGAAPWFTPTSAGIALSGRM